MPAPRQLRQPSEVIPSGHTPDVSRALGSRAVLEITGLEISFPTREGETRVVDGVSLALARGESFGLIGETGAGKSLTGWAAVDLVPAPGRISSGRVVFEGEPLTGATEARLQELRGKRIALIVQDPRASLNPMLSIGSQMANALRAHRAMTRSDAMSEAEAALRLVGVADSQRVVRAFPHQLSGGQAQRVLIAIALTNKPSLLIADEPTTGLDVTIQAEILDLMHQLVRDGSRSLWLITHDLAVVANYTDRAAVMFAGEIIEEAPTKELLEAPLHPYTVGLMDAAAGKRRSVFRVAGPPPDLHRRPPGCQFAYRCPLREAACTQTRPQLTEISKGHSVRCFVVQRNATLQ